jgi:hypothetical protein
MRLENVAGSVIERLLVTALDVKRDGFLVAARVRGYNTTSHFNLGEGSEVVAELGLGWIEYFGVRGYNELGPMRLIRGDDRADCGIDGRLRHCVGCYGTLQSVFILPSLLAGGVDIVPLCLAPDATFAQRLSVLPVLP